MRYPFVIMLAVLVLSSCGSNTEQTDNADKGHVRYSEKFVTDFRRLYGQEALLSGNKLVVDGDSIAFPQALQDGKVYMFYGKQHNMSCQLQLSKIDITSVRYSFACISGDKVVFKETDTAGLYPLFFLGSESVEEANGDSYPADVYYSTKADSCTFEIKLADGGPGKMFATVARYGCGPNGSGFISPLLKAVRE